MNDFLRNPELDQLVRELNRGEEAAPEASGGEVGEEKRRLPLSPSRRDVSRGSRLEDLLLEMSRNGASDLLLISDAPAIVRISGQLAPIGESPLDADDIREMFAPYQTAVSRQRLDDEGSVDFSLRLGRADDDEATRSRRFRVNLHRQRGKIAASVRSLPAEIPTLADLNLPPSLADLVATRQGLVLLCGPTGAGKSSTLAALLGEINRSRADHIITIEDPIEYEHRNVRSVIEQIEVGQDTPRFSSALRAALRQDPDVILVGEMRDLDTVQTALSAAETGHLILSTLHTSDAEQAIHRIIDVFPPIQQAQIRHQLALSLHAIVCQQLIPAKGERSRVPAVEVLISNNAIRNHIRHERLQNLAQEITLGRRQGMITLEDSLARLVSNGTISIEDARMRARRSDELESYLRSGA